MARAARDRLARTLRGDTQTAFSVELTARTGDLSLEVEGFGHVKFPVTPAKARKLAGLGQPARFGRGEQTLTDPDVRDTWEIPKRRSGTARCAAGLRRKAAGPPGCSARRCGRRTPWRTRAPRRCCCTRSASRT
jgi:hypothetical protein